MLLVTSAVFHAEWEPDDSVGLTRSRPGIRHGRLVASAANTVAVACTYSLAYSVGALSSSFTNLTKPC